MFDAAESIANLFVGAVAWGFVLCALATLVLWVPRLVRRFVNRSTSPGDRVAATVLLVAVLLPVAYVSVPFSEGPYRCTSVVAGAEGRQTVYPDDEPIDLFDPDRDVEAIRSELQRRDHVCADAAKARGVQAGMTLAGGLLLGLGMSVIWSRSAAVRDTFDRA